MPSAKAAVPSCSGTDACCTVVGDKTIKPHEAFGMYAPPEVLDVLTSRRDPSQRTPQLVDGAAVDAWGVGITLLEALTSHQHFVGSERTCTSGFRFYTHMGDEISDREYDRKAEIRFSQQGWVSLLLENVANQRYSCWAGRGRGVHQSLHPDATYTF